jgi:hypothetical protein
MNLPPQKQLAIGLALARVGIGSVGCLAPGFLIQTWTGMDRRSKQVRAVGLAVAARDLALGLGMLQAIRSGGNTGAWMRCGALADAADCLATVRAYGDLPRSRRGLIVLMAAGSAGAAWWLVREVSH